MSGRKGEKPKNWNTLYTPEIQEKRREYTKKMWKEGKLYGRVIGKQGGKLKRLQKNRDLTERQKVRKKFTNNRYRARKRKSEGIHTFGEWEILKKQYGYICPACGKSEPEIKLSEDHIIPLSKGGSDFIENIQPLCIKCNCIKNTKIIKF